MSWVSFSRTRALGALTSLAALLVGGMCGIERLPKQERPTPPHSVRGILRVSVFGEGAAPAGPPLLHRSVYTVGSDYTGMEDNDLRGFLDGRFKYGWNQPTQSHVRAGRRPSSARYGEHELFRFLQRWSGVELPRDARVRRARLQLSVERGPHRDMPMMLYEVRKDWNPGQGGVHRDSNSPPAEGEVWWMEAAHGQRPWGLPGAGFASDTHPDADTGATPLAETMYRENGTEIAFESPALAAYVERRAREGAPLLFLVKLADHYEDRLSSLLYFFSANADAPRNTARRPHLEIEWDAPSEVARLEREVHLEHGRTLELAGLEAPGGRQLAVSFFPADGHETPSMEARASGETGFRPASLPRRIEGSGVDVRMVAARDPVAFGDAFRSRFRDTWITTGPPEGQQVVWTFVSPAGVVHRAPARYAGDYVYEIAFEPSDLGRWRYWFEHRLDKEYRSADGFFDVVPGDRENVVRNLRELHERIRAEHPEVEKEAHEDLVETYGETFARLERAVMSFETPDSYASHDEDELFQLLTQVREAMTGRKVPEQPKLRAMERVY